MVARSPSQLATQIVRKIYRGESHVVRKVIIALGAGGASARAKARQVIFFHRSRPSSPPQQAILQSDVNYLLGLTLLFLESVTVRRGTTDPT